ncbi:Cytochrome p450 86a2 [Globisporangium polare]
MLVLPPISSLTAVQVLTAALTVALTGVLMAIASSIYRKMRAAKLLAPVPGPKGWFILGILPALAQNIHHIYDYKVKLMIHYGGRTKVPWNIVSNNMLCLSDPKDVEYVLSTNMKNWIKSEQLIASIGDLFERGFLGTNHAHTADGGARWRLQRKIITRVFTTSNFRVFTEGIFHKYTMRVVDLIDAQNGKVDMHTMASQYTLQTIFDISCGVPLHSIDKDLGLKFIKAMDYVFGTVTERFILRPYFRYFWWCMPSEYRLKRESKVMVDLVDGILHQRLKESDEEIKDRFDVLSLSIKKARELEGEGEGILDIPTLRSFLATTIFGGRDTTSSLIQYCFYNLAQYPEEQDKISEELKTVDTTKMTFDDVKTLKYLDAFVWETLRLYPTVPVNVKQAAEDDVLPDGTFVPAGTEIVYSPYYMGRNNATLWGDDQLVFRPERWLEMEKRPTAYEFPAFQGGPRICPGMNMALLEVKIFISILLQKFHVKIQDGEQVKDRSYMLGATMMMKGGLPLQLTARQAASAS